MPNRLTPPSLHTPSITNKINDNTPRENIPDKPFALSGLPFVNHVRRLAIPSSATASREELETELGTAFLDLLDLCISTVRHAPDYPPGAPSYNVLLTLGHMYVFPRRQDAHVLAASGERLNVNALGFADSYSSRVPPSLTPLWPRAPERSSRASLARACMRPRSPAGQSWMVTWGSHREHWHANSFGLVCL